MGFFFFLFAIVAVAGAVGVVALRNPFYCALSLAVHLIALALLFLLLEAQFVAAAQVVVYAGAVVVLYVFVVVYVGGGSKPEPLWRASARQRGLAGLFGAAIFIELSIAILGTGLKALDGDGAKLGAGYGSPGQIGELLLIKHLLAFELASFLLLIAAVAAVALAGRRQGLEDDVFPDMEIVDVRRPAATGTMGEAVGGYGLLVPPAGSEPAPEPAKPEAAGGAPVGEAR